MLAPNWKRAFPPLRLHPGRYSSLPWLGLLEDSLPTENAAWLALVIVGFRSIAEGDSASVDT